jgi:nitrate reductase cytochrome c-type subunit
MKLLLKLVSLAVVLAAPAVAEDEIADRDLGLSRTSVFDTPEPAAYGYDGSAPAIPAMSALDVPVIPHEIRQLEKITVERNRCLNCHLDPELIGKTVPEGEPTPIPASHYLGDPATSESPQVAGARWVCTQCHVAQSDTDPLVRNTTVK